MYTLTLNATTYEELAQQVADLKGGFSASPAPAPRDEPSVEELLATLRAKLKSQNLAVVVQAAAKTAKADAAVDELAKDDRVISISPEAEEAPAATPKKKSNGGVTKLPKEAAAAALGTETPAGRKARCVAELQTLFANGKKAEVLKILAELGDGAKTFGAVPEANFAAISDALVTMV